MLEQYALLAAYNADMNRKLYDAAATLPAAQWLADRKAFFGSLCGTLNHLVAADTIWLMRFALHPAAHPALAALRGQPIPTALTQIYSDDLATLTAQRRRLDATIVRFIAELSEADLNAALRYGNTKGVVSDKLFASVLLHFFNHQTHHRGQASTLLSQAGADVGVTDFLAWVPNLPQR